MTDSGAAIGAAAKIDLEPHIQYLFAVDADLAELRAERDRLICAIYASGTDEDEIALAVGLSSAGVLRILDSHGVKLRPTSERQGEP